MTCNTALIYLTVTTPQCWFIVILLIQTQMQKADSFPNASKPHRYSPQNRPSSDWSAQSFLPSQIWWGCRQVDVSLAQGCVGGSHMDEVHDSSSEWSSQSLSPSQTQLLLMHLPRGETKKYIKLSNLIGYFQVSILIFPKEVKGCEEKKKISNTGKGRI